MTTQATLDRYLLTTLGLSIESANIVMEQIEELRGQIEVAEAARDALRAGDTSSPSIEWICTQTWREHAKAGRWWQGRVVGTLRKVWDAQLVWVTDEMIRTTDFGDVWWSGPVEPPPMPDEARAHTDASLPKQPAIHPAEAYLGAAAADFADAPITQPRDLISAIAQCATPATPGAALEERSHQIDPGASPDT